VDARLRALKVAELPGRLSSDHMHALVEECRRQLAGEGSGDL
jgi:hypothetical protein